MPPEPRRADAGEQQGADPRGVAADLQVAHVAVYLDALAEGAEGVLVDAGERGDDVLVDQPEVLDLLFDLVEALADQVEHIAALVQLPFQGQHRQGVAQRFALQAAGLALQGAGQGFEAVAQVEAVATVDVQGAGRVARQQAAEHAAQRGFADLSGACQLVDQGCGFEDGAEGNQLLSRIAHGRPPKSQASAVSITPPPRQTSPS